MDYAIGVFLGLIIFHLVAETLAVAPTIIVGQPNLVKKWYSRSRCYRSRN